jgi:hypothetical protein
MTFKIDIAMNRKPRDALSMSARKNDRIKVARKNDRIKVLGFGASRELVEQIEQERERLSETVPGVSTSDTLRAIVKRGLLQRFTTVS